MAKLNELEKLVRNLYEAQNPKRSDWADWLYQYHVIWVADKATELAGRFNVDAELSRVAALLHDVADVNMERFVPNHAEESLALARKLMAQAGYTEEQISLVVDDAIRLHSCHDGVVPNSSVGKVLSTADAMAHFLTNFYPFAYNSMTDRPLDVINSWALEKIERDFNDKIQFDEIREEVRPAYKTLKTIFSSSIVG